MKKVFVVVNKNWETDGVMSALVNSGLHPAALPFPDNLHTPPYGKQSQTPRAEFSLKDNDGSTVLSVKVLCIQDYMSPKQSSSSSEEKAKVLEPVLTNKNDMPDLIISVSTAGYPDEVCRNGSVIIGGNFLLFDGHPDNPKSNLKNANVGKLLVNNVNSKVYALINADFKNSVEPKFLKAPKNPCPEPACIASDVFTALSVINITEYQEYNWADEEALEYYYDTVPRLPCRSSETTHGVVKLCSKSPILFLSPITDQFGCFDFDVTPTQNFAACFNGGIVIAQLLCTLKDYVQNGGEFKI